MKAQVYLLSERRGNAMDVYMVCGSQQEAIDYYRKVTGRPGRISARTQRDGFEHLTLDEDRTGAGYVNPFVVGVDELIPSPQNLTDPSSAFDRLLGRILDDERLGVSADQTTRDAVIADALDAEAGQRR